jgi:hypothetical protein
LSHQKIQQSEKNGVNGVGKIKKYQVYSPPGQGSSQLISSLTAATLEVVTAADLPAQFAVQAQKDTKSLLPAAN